MTNKFSKNIIIFIIFSTFLCILIAFNSSTIQLVKKYFEIKKLEKKIDETTIYNDDLRKRLLYLQTQPTEMEKEVKSNLGYIAEDEILYKFNDYKEKDKI